MRILYMTKSFTSHDRRFLLALSQTVHQIYFLQLSDKNNKIDLPPAINEVSLPQPNFFAIKYPQTLLNQLQKIIDQINPDLIHAGPIHTVAAWVARLKYRPLVTMSWGYDLLLDADKNSSYQNLTKMVLDATTVLICDCQATLEKASIFGFPTQKVITFPWGVDLQHFSPRPEQILRNQLNWQNKFVILSARSFEPIYGVDIIAHAFIKLVTKNPEARLLLLGDGSLKPAIQAIFQTAKVMDKVHFAGHISQQSLPDYYNTADLYVSASQVDGSSVSLLEAMACGVAVIVSDIAGNKEWIENEKQGWIFKVNQIDELAEKINLAMHLSPQLKIMGNNARQTVEQRADWKKNFPRLLTAYELACSL